MEKAKLSVMLVTRNEAAKIRRCLKSVRRADKIAYLADNPDFAKKMGKAGRRRIEENFSINRNVR